jgi:hypothetical protein
MAADGGLFRMFAAIRAPCSVNALTDLENFKLRKDITVCDVPRIRGCREKKRQDCATSPDILHSYGNANGL